MRLRNIVSGVMAFVALALVSCEEVEHYGIPQVAVTSDAELVFDIEGGKGSFSFTSTRDWKVQSDADWVVVDPEKGSAAPDGQTIEVSVLKNEGRDRVAELQLTIGMLSRTITVNQKGPQGSPEDLIVYFNDFDKEVAQKTYGSGSSYPYLDQFDGWVNHTGTGVKDVKYNFSGMSTRSNSTSDSNYSDYEGSGDNNMFFGSNAYLAINNITLGNTKDFTLTFGTEKYDGNNKEAMFDPAEFHVFLSNDGAKWVEIDYTFAGTTAGRWNFATANFTLPEQTTALWMCVKADVASVYRMDDLKLVLSEEAGAAVDFSKAEDMDFTAGGNISGGGNTGDVPVSAGKKTVQEFISAADTQNYYELTGKVSGFNATYCSFDLTDDSGKIYVYSVLAASKSEWSSKIKNGGTATIYGKYMFYEQKSQHEVVDAYIVSFTESGSTGGGNVPDGTAIYSNNFDKVVAEKTYGTSASSWPYLDQFSGWQNQAGTGASDVSYSFNGMSARANSTSDSSYSDYSGSGNNNMFFGKSAYFSIRNIALGGKTNLSLSFGSEKYSQTDGSVFKNSEYHIWLSNDNGAKWVEFTDYTFAGGTTEGRWNVATANFTVPAGTDNLSICFAVDVASAYRMDDVKLVEAASAGASVDFSKAVAKDFGSATPSTPVTPPVSGGGKNFTKVTSIESGKAYLIVAGTKAAVPVGSDKNYGYLNVIDVTDNGGVINADAANAFVFTAVNGGYTIRQSDGRYLYMTGTYNSCNLDNNPSSGHIWDVEARSDGTMLITNVEMDKTLQYDSNYSSYGVYPDTRGAFPALYVEGEGSGDSGSGDGGNDDGGNTGATGEYEPQLQWTLGSGAYDNTSSSTSKQSAKINGVSVSNLLKLGKGSDVGNATIHVPAGTRKLGFYCIAWKGKTSTSAKFSVGGSEIKTIKPAENAGATGNPEYTITLSSSDWYEIDLPSTSAQDVKVETLDKAQGRVLIIGLKAIK